MIRPCKCYVYNHLVISFFFIFYKIKSNKTHKDNIRFKSNLNCEKWPWRKSTVTKKISSVDGPWSQIFFSQAFICHLAATQLLLYYLIKLLNMGLVQQFTRLLPVSVARSRIKFASTSSTKTFLKPCLFFPQNVCVRHCAAYEGTGKTTITFMVTWLISVWLVQTPNWDIISLAAMRL